ncbi:MAG: hypothetical protein ACP5ML_02145 [Fervidicoccus sp.]
MSKYIYLKMDDKEEERKKCEKDLLGNYDPQNDTCEIAMSSKNRIYVNYDSDEVYFKRVKGGSSEKIYSTVVENIICGGAMALVNSLSHGNTVPFSSAIFGTCKISLEKIKKSL